MGKRGQPQVFLPDGQRDLERASVMVDLLLLRPQVLSNRWMDTHGMSSWIPPHGNIVRAALEEGNSSPSAIRLMSCFPDL